jgi:hypothetical protein
METVIFVVTEKYFSYKKERMFICNSGKHRPIEYSETCDLNIFTPKKKKKHVVVCNFQSK